MGKRKKKKILFNQIVLQGFETFDLQAWFLHLHILVSFLQKVFKLKFIKVKTRGKNTWYDNDFSSSSDTPLP